MADEAKQETADEIVARLGKADDAELAELANDERVTVTRAVAAEQAKRTATDADSVLARAQTRTGRPPAHEVSKEIYDRVYAAQADAPVNADAEALAIGAGAAPGDEGGAS
jgi:hypothetical protein